MSTPKLEQLFGKYYAASTLKRGSTFAIITDARAQMDEDAALKAEAETELKRLSGMGTDLKKRCVISANRREFLQKVFQQGAEAHG